uniref:Equilibrative nucleotide transporter 3-like n=1 Tax=Populus alba TaxID=43335 RepID=A0A4U5N7B5_POPAL|nr:hypothetical protein D5086_0000280450 [Populus alba]
MTIPSGSGVPAPMLKGKHKAIVVCWFLGLGSLVSWNSILTIEDYYYDLFPKYHPSRVLTLVYQPFALGTMALLTYNEAKINTRKRNIAGYMLFTASTLMLIVVDLVTSGKGGVGPYIGICAVVAALGVADAHVQGGMVGDLSFMCPEFVQSFFAGLAAIGGSDFCFEATDESSCLRSLKMVYERELTTDSEYYRAKAASEGSNYDDKPPERLSNKELFLQNTDYALDLFLIYVLTLSIFPGFLYEDTGKHQLGSWYSLVLVAVFNVWDLISRYIPLVECLKLESRNGLMIASLSRFLLVPAFFFTAKHGDQGWMIMLTSFLGLTNGYLSVCVLTEAPKGYKGPEQNALGNLLVLCLFAGIFSGVVLDWLWLIGK